MRSQNGNDYEEAFTQGQLSHFAIWQKLTQHCKSTTFHLIKKERERERNTYGAIREASVRRALC